MTELLPFIDLAKQRRRITAEVDAAIAAVLDHGKFIMGPEVARLEAELCDFTGVSHTVACSSGTDALVLALLAHNVGPGDAVVVPTFTFAATAEAVALLGATPVFADIDATTFNVDPASIEDVLVVAADVGLRPVGIIPVDLFGLPADYAAISRIATRDGLWVLGDAAQSLGGSTGASAVGLLAEVTITSFFPAKPLGCYGDGGAVFCQDEAYDKVLRSLRVHGQGSDKYDNVRIGINGRIDTLQAAILLVKLGIFADEIHRRQEVARRYNVLLDGVAITPEVPDGSVSAWAQYTIRVESRDAVVAELRKAGVPTAVYYPRPLHQQTAYRDFPTAPPMGESQRVAGEVLSLPMHPYLEIVDQERIAAALHHAVAVTAVAES
jgi:dTDP-4-amino-4,6-dideoxygalactose transaminase